MDAFQLWKYKFRCSWASEQSREATTCLLARRLAIATPSPIPYCDTGLVTLYVSEELDGSCILRVRLQVLLATSSALHSYILVLIH